MATHLNNLGGAYDSLGDFEKAIDRKVYGERHPSVARELNNLGFAYKSLGEVTKAIEFCEAAYGIWLEFFGGDHPHTQIAGESLAIMKLAL